MSERPRTYNVLNILMRFHAFPDEVMEKFCLVECTVPVGAGAPPNHHAGETEAFFILGGEVAFQVGDTSFVAGAGGYVPIPDGAVHAFRAVGTEPARLLIVNAPGRMHESFFTSVGEALEDGRTTLPDPREPDITAVMAAAQASGMTILAPAEA